MRPFVFVALLGPEVPLHVAVERLERLRQRHAEGIADLPAGERAEQAARVQAEMVEEIARIARVLASKKRDGPGG